MAGDDVIVDALRTIAPGAALIAGAAVAATTLPLTARVSGFVNQSLTALLILIATLTTARVVAGMVQSLAGRAPEWPRPRPSSSTSHGSWSS